MSKYSETHHLNVDEAGLASVHVAVHLQDVNPMIARQLVLRVLDAAAAVAGLTAPEREETLHRERVVRPQTSGPCVHIDSVDDDDPIEVQVLGYACRHPHGHCQHLEALEIVCPLKDALYAMRAVAGLRAECEAEQEEQDAEMAGEEGVYEKEVPEFIDPGLDDSEGLPAYVAKRVRRMILEGGDVPRSQYVLSPRPAPAPAEAAAPAAPEDDLPPDDAPIPSGADEPPAPPDGAQEPSDSPPEVPPPEEEIVFQDGMRWTEAEIEAIASADGPTEAIRRYREAFPTSLRGDGSITTRLYIVRKKRSAISIHDLIGMRVEVRLRLSPHYGRIGRVARVNEAGELMVQFDDDPATYWVSPEGVTAIEEGS
ncbi:MAG: hypothetical protein WC277_08545 [Bacilli bacterium]